MPLNGTERVRKWKNDKIGEKYTEINGDGFYDVRRASDHPVRVRLCCTVLCNLKKEKNDNNDKN